MKNYSIVLIALLCTAPAFGYIYRAQFFKGSLPGKHSINVFVLSDVHQASEEAIEQRKAIINTVLQMGTANTQVLAEDACCYSGKDAKVLRNIEKLRDDPSEEELLPFLVEHCQKHGINATGVECRFLRENKHTARQFEQELCAAKKEVEGYTDDRALTKIYQEQLRKDFTSKATELVKKTANDFTNRETRLDDTFHDLTRKRLRARGLLAPERAGVPATTAAVIAPTPQSIALLLQQAPSSTAQSLVARIAHTTQIEQQMQSTIDRIKYVIETTRRIMQETDDMQEDLTTLAGSKIVDCKVLHELANLPSDITDVIICVGGEHAENIAQMLTKLHFSSLFQRGERDSDPLDVHNFFKHYFINSALTAGPVPQATLTSLRPAHTLTGHGVGKRKSCS